MVIKSTMRREWHEPCTDETTKATWKILVQIRG